MLGLKPENYNQADINTSVMTVEIKKTIEICRSRFQIQFD
jgi:hypothetical protein